MKDLNLVIEGYNNNLNCLLSVKLSVDDPKYSKFGKDFFDDEYINDEVFKYFDRYYMSISDKFIAWYQQNKEKAWFDLLCTKRKSPDLSRGTASLLARIYYSRNLAL